MPGRAACGCGLILSMNASSCSGSWWNRHSRPAPAALASRMPCCQLEWPQPSLRRQFLVGVGRVEDHDSSASLVSASSAGSIGPSPEFDVGHIGDGLAAVFDPVADRAAGMIERCGSQGDAGPGIDHVAGAEVVEFELGVQRVDLKRKQRKAHQLAHRLLDAAGGLQAAGPDADDLTLARTTARRTAGRSHGRCGRGSGRCRSRWCWPA